MLTNARIMDDTIVQRGVEKESENRSKQALSTQKKHHAMQKFDRDK